MRISVDRERCCGAGNCVLAAPEVFDQDDRDGLVVLLAPEPSGDVVADVRRAAETCPAGVIALT